MKTYLFAHTIICAFVFCNCVANAQIEHDKRARVDSLYFTFADDGEIRARMYLVQKYRPGHCFGMPMVEPPARAQRKIEPALLSKIKQLLSNQSDGECEAVIRDMARINLVKKAVGRYDFEFKDGKCCSITHYKGSLIFQKDGMTEHLDEKSIEIVPC